MIHGNSKLRGNGNTVSVFLFVKYLFYYNNLRSVYAVEENKWLKTKW